MKCSAFLLAIVLFFPFPLLADEDHHHEEVTADQLGTVHFPVSCSPSAQKTFERGVALLHSFWYEEAEKTFQQVASDDPRCAMAHWGIAMSLWHQLWDNPSDATLKRGADELKKAKSLHSKDAREQQYIAALDAFYEHRNEKHRVRATAYSQRMEQLYQKYPDDHEAGIFYALSLLASEPDKDTTYVNRKKAAAVLEKIFAEEPNH